MFVGGVLPATSDDEIKGTVKKKVANLK